MSNVMSALMCVKFFTNKKSNDIALLNAKYIAKERNNLFNKTIRHYAETLF